MFEKDTCKCGECMKEEKSLTFFGFDEDGKQVEFQEIKCEKCETKYTSLQMFDFRTYFDRRQPTLPEVFIQEISI